MRPARAPGCAATSGGRLDPSRAAASAAFSAARRRRRRTVQAGGGGGEGGVRAGRTASAPAAAAPSPFPPLWTVPTPPPTSPYCSPRPPAPRIPRPLFVSQTHTHEHTTQHTRTTHDTQQLHNLVYMFLIRQVWIEARSAARPTPHDVSRHRPLPHLRTPTLSTHTTRRLASHTTRDLSSPLLPLPMRPFAALHPVSRVAEGHASTPLEWTP